jgi:DNA-binding NarL/FixJ family response regulator
VRDHDGVRTVLIVDDHDAFRASARALLEADGYAVVGEAADGRRPSAP